MTKNQITSTAAALVCTIVMSATCLFAAVAPAQQAAVSSPATHQVA